MAWSDRFKAAQAAGEKALLEFMIATYRESGPARRLYRTVGAARRGISSIPLIDQHNHESVRAVFGKAEELKETDGREYPQEALR